MPGKPAGTEAQEGAGPGNGVPCDRTRILIVDDEDTILQLFVMILSSALPDHAFDLARNGREAVQAFGERHHAVLLMDLFMPVMDGQEAFFAVRTLCRERRWDMPSVVFCTGFAPPQSLESVLQTTPEHCLLRKPVSGEMLIETVRQRLG